LFDEEEQSPYFICKDGVNPFFELSHFDLHWSFEFASLFVLSLSEQFWRDCVFVTETVGNETAVENGFV
jgi:hypothetical protein